jgi:archaemetzincin
MRLSGVLCLCLLFVGCNKSHQPLLIGIRPIGTVNAEKIELVKQALDSVYHARVIVLQQQAPPSQAFVNIKTPRYRADKLIAWLKQNKPDTLDYVIGLTAYDISITKSDWLGRIKEPRSRYEDFGIFGLGYKPGKSCVVSSFRLGNDAHKLKDRFAKISVHEIGHNLGLDHCPNKRCVMTDAVEKISTIDNAEMRLCERCKRI